MNNLLKCEKYLTTNVISCLSGNPAECKSLLNIIPLDSRVKPENDREVGRSMVEMLGVLAVMGVLSVAGIAGYNSAMNKHRANELLNEASKRATVVAGQVTMGGRTPSLSEFTNPTGYTFDVKGPDGAKAWVSGDNQFTLTITGVSEAVCNHMQNMKTALIQKFEPSDCATSATVKLTYNADLSMGSSSDPSGGTEPPDNGCTNGQYRCESGVLEKCVNGVWGTAGTLSGKSCNGDVVETILCSWEYGQNWGQYRCHNGQYQVCHDGPGSWLQITPPCGKECDENDNLVDVTESCSLGETRCFRGTYEICKNEAGCVRWVQDGEVPSGKYCQGDELVDGICTPGESSCQNGLTLYCFDDGTLTE